MWSGPRQYGTAGVPFEGRLDRIGLGSASNRTSTLETDGGAMATWSAFADAAPDLASETRRLIDAWGRRRGPAGDRAWRRPAADPPGQRRDRRRPPVRLRHRAIAQAHRPRARRPVRDAHAPGPGGAERGRPARPRPARDGSGRPGAGRRRAGRSRRRRLRAVRARHRERPARRPPDRRRLAAGYSSWHEGDAG